VPLTAQQRRTFTQLLLVAAIWVAFVVAALAFWGFHPDDHSWDGTCYPGDRTFSYLEGAFGWSGAVLVFAASVVMMVRGPSRLSVGVAGAGLLAWAGWIVVLATLWPSRGSIPC
jgi:hypothetical protein